MHQDQAWWQMSPADDMLSVSIQIDGATAANGCIELFPGYHDRLRTPVGSMQNFCPREVAGIDASTGVKMETQPGDVLIFHSLTPHQSGTNTADVSRRSLYLTYSARRVGDLYQEHLKMYIARLSEEPRVKGRAFFK
jgi:ectoine hydroxylase-related dioxygenase (phytanoyl-CoA dioxygenase family)